MAYNISFEIGALVKLSGRNWVPGTAAKSNAISRAGGDVEDAHCFN